MIESNFDVLSPPRNEGTQPRYTQTIAKIIAYARLKNAYGTVQANDLEDMWPRMMVEAQAVADFMTVRDVENTLEKGSYTAEAAALMREFQADVERRSGVPFTLLK